MASIYDLKAGQLLTIPETDKTTVCKMCLEVAQPKLNDKDEASSTIRLGDLYEYGNPITDKDTGKADIEVYCAHYFCLLFSSGLEQKGREEDEGLKGFLPQDVLKEWRRGQRLKCTECNQKYATVGCSHKSCRKTFHLPCAVRSGAHLQYCGAFSLFCNEHRLKQAPYKDGGGGDKLPETECGICYDDIPDMADDLANVWSPCCNKWFHKTCVQRFADTSGYFFKCPLCNNKDDFIEEMKRFGIYVPEKDADWEKPDRGAASGDPDDSSADDEAFGSLLERHDNCDVPNCICPEGRKKDEDYTEWEIILCWYCGAQGTHVRCSDLPLQNETEFKLNPIKWKCQFCAETLKKMPKKRIHQFRPITLNKKSSKKAALSELLNRTTIKLGTGSQISFNVHERHLVGKTWVGNKYQPHRELKLKYSLAGQLGAPSGKVHAEITDPSMKVKLAKPPSQLASASVSSASTSDASIVQSTPRAAESSNSSGESEINCSIVVPKSVDKAPSQSDPSPAIIHSPHKRALSPVKSLPPDTTPNSSKMSKSKCQRKTHQTENVDEGSPVKKKARLSGPLIKSPKKKYSNKLSPMKSNGSNTNSAQSLNPSLGAKNKQQKTILSYFSSKPC